MIPGGPPPWGSDLEWRGDLARQTVLTKRELFAAMSLQGLCGSEGCVTWTREQLVREAVEQADALIAALDATP